MELFHQLPTVLELSHKGLYFHQHFFEHGMSKWAETNKMELNKNKTPAEAFTPPAEKKIGAKWAFMSNCSGREHEKWLFKNI